MMTQQQIDAATLEELNEELAAGGMPSGEADLATARKSARALIAEFAQDTTVAGHTVLIDRSGQGHNWQTIDREEIPANVILEIEGEIIDGEKDSGQIVASNGLHYRWIA